ncbi:MAG TPA: ABC transporter ATP-binding protein [Gemmataceae bacterium]|jgi:putative ABC transport system ATP-binding protein|nr:ABC transporter ATP-binding protein [Gemmataceae bacterium]
MPPQIPVLRGSRLTRIFGDGASTTNAVDRVSIQLYPGRVALLMGPSGSGKSTLLSILSGLLPPDSGEVIALEESLWELSERQRQRFRLRHCGFVFQNLNLLSALTALQHLEMVLRWGEGVSPSEARQRSQEMLALVGLASKTTLIPSQLSGGEKQRVAIARALIKRPTFCFADEPTGALDWAHGRHVIEMLCAAARQQNTCLLIVTHDVRLIPFADEVFHLEDGRLDERMKGPE